MPDFESLYSYRLQNKIVCMILFFDAFLELFSLLTLNSIL